jgi:hypothetical protein
MKLQLCEIQPETVITHAGFGQSHECQFTRGAVERNWDMTDLPIIDFIASPIGSGIIWIGSSILCGSIVYWASHPRHPNRWNLLIAAAGATILLAAISLSSVLMGWWGGAYYERIPLMTHFAISLPLSFVGWVIWMLLYRLLERLTRHAFPIYMIAMLVFIPIVDVMDRLNMERGVLTLGSGYTILSDIGLGLITMWTPVLFYEWIKRQRKSVAVLAD